MTGVAIPAGVTSLGAGTFRFCPRLKTVVFRGDAPDLPAGGTFAGSAPDFSLYYLADKTGFTSPTWTSSGGEVFPAQKIGGAKWPAASWLLSFGLWCDTSLLNDPNNDGIPFLTAYALDIDPRLNLRSHLPAPVLTGNTLSLTFPARRPDITYRVETSTDLRTWLPATIVRPAPGEDLQVTTTIPVSASAPARFLRLVITK